MPFSARTPNGEVVLSLNFDSSIEIRKKHPVLLSPFPDCDIEVFPRQCLYKQLHFVHKSAPKTEWNHHPVSLEHELGKLAIAEYYQKLFLSKGMTGVEIGFEVPIAKMKRIADVGIFVDGIFVKACEYQRSPISMEQLERRTQDYDAEGIEVEWYFGGICNTKNVQNWSIERFSFCLYIEHSKSTSAIREEEIYRVS